MPTTRADIQDYIQRLSQRLDADGAHRRLAPDTVSPLKPRIRPTKRVTATALSAAWRTLLAETHASEDDKRLLADPETMAALAAYAANIENMIGTLKLPVGVIGPLRINGIHAEGDYYVPLATSEATLVASYGRGAGLVSAAGGVSAAVLNEGVQRAPGFAFDTLATAGLFAAWAARHFEMLKTAAEATTRHGKLTDLTPHVEGNHVYLICRYSTGDAAGQNMVTIATEALCRALLAECPHQPRYWFVEANLSGDKKASALAFLMGRGRSATAEIRLPGPLVEQHLHTSVERMHDYWRMSALAGVMSGTLGVHGHYANGIAALYLATGQDVACVAESSVGITRMEIHGTDLHVSVTLPSLMLGTVGGGTSLPAQAVGLRILGLQGAGNAQALAEVAAGLCLAGEVSIIGALAAGEFGAAHGRLARDRR